MSDPPDPGVSVPAPQAKRASLAPHPPLPDEGAVEISFTCEGVGVPWVVLDLTLTETLAEPYVLSARVQTDEVDFEPSLMLMKRASFFITRGTQEQRVQGIVAELVEGATSSRELVVELVVVPALWLLGQRRDTRVFQEQTVPEILAEVLGAAWLDTYQRTVRFELDRGDYPTCEYRVQYDETDLQFVHRLMQEEGIFYWFEHGETAEVMVVADSTSRFEEIERPSGESLVATRVDVGLDRIEVLREFHRRSRVLPTRQSTRHHDWTRAVQFTSALDGEEPASELPPHGARSLPTREEYDHDRRPVTFYGYREEARAYQETDYLEQIRLRRQAQARDARVGQGRSTIVSMRPARTFTVSGHAQLELEGEYAITHVEHRFNAGSASWHYDNTLRCLPKDVPYRPERRARRPRIEGLLTAEVVGPPGEEIHTDEHGRIKIQFYWDRLGASDEKSSCWVRVVQPWAGSGWGFVFVPRVGMEVAVTFVDGDPDRPIVTGTLYNGQNAPPHELPQDKTRSTLKTRSVPGGNGYNELAFEDRAGQEQVELRAQRDFSTLVGRNQKTEVRRDSVVVVRGRQSNLVTGDLTERVSGAVQRSALGDQLDKINGAHLESVRGKAELSVGEDRTVEVGGAERREVKRTATMVTGDDVTVETAGHHATHVGTDEDKRSFVVYSHGTTELSSSEMTEVVSDKGIRLRCGDSVLEIMPDEIQLISPKMVLRAPNARVEVDGDRIYVFGERKAEVKSNTVVLKAAAAGVSLRTEAQIDGAQILLNSPVNASDPVLEEDVPLTQLELCDEEGAPLANQRFILVFEDGSERTGFLDEEGKAEIFLEEGAKIRFPGLLEPTSC